MYRNSIIPDDDGKLVETNISKIIFYLGSVHCFVNSNIGSDSNSYGRLLHYHMNKAAKGVVGKENCNAM